MPVYQGIEGVNIAKLNSANIDEPENPDYPWKLELTFRAPEFMNMAFIMLYGGSEDLVVQGMTREALDQFLDTEDLRQHPRLNRGTITHPDGTVEELSRDQLRG